MFITTNSEGKSTTDMNRQFVCSQMLLDFLLQLKPTEEDKNEFINYLKIQYKGNPTELSNVCEFEQNYSSNEVLSWYTRQSFFYKTLNAALRTQDIHVIFLFRAFIFDIYQKLQRCQAYDSLRVYRSQMMSTEELKTLKKYVGQFISMNSFLSTSTDRSIALSFLGNSYDSYNLERVLFEIHADPYSGTMKPFANISKYSYFTTESEVLFMVGSIFRLQSINRDDDNQVWSYSYVFVQW